MKTLADLDLTENGALFNEEHTHRYLLWRVDLKKEPRHPGWLAWLGLNPSKADGERNDNTITRVTDYTLQEGYGRFFMVNFHAFIATNPKDLVRAQVSHGTAFVRGAEGLHWIDQAFAVSDEIVCAWGSHSAARQLHCAEVWRRLMGQPNKLRALRVSQEGAPAHPLRLPAKLRLEPVGLLRLGRVRYTV